MAAIFWSRNSVRDDAQDGEQPRDSHPAWLTVASGAICISATL